MNRFQMTAETAIQTGKPYDIPDEYLEAYCVTRGMTWQEYRTIPRPTLEKVLQLWRLDDYRKEYESKKNNPK